VPDSTPLPHCYGNVTEAVTPRAPPPAARPGRLRPPPVPAARPSPVTRPRDVRPVSRAEVAPNRSWRDHPPLTRPHITDLVQAKRTKRLVKVHQIRDKWGRTRILARATLRGHEQPGPAPGRTWPAGMKWLARLDMAPARRQVARRTRDVASGGVPLAPGPAPSPLTRPLAVRANPPEIPGPAGCAAPRPALTRPKPACRGSSCPQDGPHPGANHAVPPPSAPPPRSRARAGRPAPAGDHV
jgi:hypothetical protein